VIRAAIGAVVLGFSVVSGAHWQLSRAARPGRQLVVGESRRCAGAAGVGGRRSHLSVGGPAERRARPGSSASSPILQLAALPVLLWWAGAVKKKTRGFGSRRCALLVRSIWSPRIWARSCSPRPNERLARHAALGFLVLIGLATIDSASTSHAGLTGTARRISHHGAAVCRAEGCWYHDSGEW